MRISKLKLANMRAIEAAELRFQPGFNLIVGVNGVGKTTVLEALGVVLSGIVKHSNKLRAKSDSFSDGDIRKTAQALTAECTVQLGDHEYNYLVHKTRATGESQASKAGMPREQTLNTPDRAEFVGDSPTPSTGPRVEGRPFGLFFSTRRAVSSAIHRSHGSAAGGIAAACAEAFAHRELRLSEFAQWMRARDVLRRERVSDGDVLDVLRSVTRKFLPDYDGVWFTEDDPPRLFINRGSLTTTRVDQLSDGERARLKEATDWVDSWMAHNWRSDVTLSDDDLQLAHIQAKESKLKEALGRFLPHFENLRVLDKVQAIDRSPIPIDVALLSDGERGTLALVLDITRRLVQANPEMTDPTGQAEAVVLIDEIDLHLHPKWQRTIIENLTKAFPRCQFIATTHSPQIIAAVEPERVLLLTGTGVVQPDRTLGMDSNWILRHIMEAADRPAGAADVIQSIEALIKMGSFSEARAAISEAKVSGLDLPEWSVLEARMARLELLAR